MKSFRICSPFPFGLLVGVLLCGICLTCGTNALVCYHCRIITKGPTNSRDPCYDPRRTGAPIKVCEGYPYRTSNSNSTEPNVTVPTEAPTSSSTPEYIIEPPPPNYTDYVNVCRQVHDKDNENSNEYAFLYRGCDFVHKDFQRCYDYKGRLECLCNQRDVCNDEVAYKFGLTIGKAANLKNPYALLVLTGCFQLSVYHLLVLNSLQWHQSDTRSSK